MIRTRFAPSPTGSLHVGNARIAVLNWLFTQHKQGRFVLRIEDTDEARNVPGAEVQLMEDLAWLGLQWDEGPDVGGDFGPYRQSERAAHYSSHAYRLRARGRVYPCFCTAEELEARRVDAIARGESAVYDGRCRRLTPAEAVAFERAGRPYALRFRLPVEETIVVTDVVRGEVRFDPKEIGDFIILRSDQQPTYNFAVVVDDIVMRITHVIRGVGHLSNTPRQVALYDAFGVKAPVFAHVPQVLGPDRQKLSKRHGAKALIDYRREGYHPDAVVNYLSLLSWSSASGDEFLVRNRLINEISLERIGASDVVFDPAKLRWLSSKHIEAMPVEELAEAVSVFIDRERFPIAEEHLPVILAAVRTHLATFSDINEQLAPFVPLAGISDATREELLSRPGSREVVIALQRVLSERTDWSETNIEAAIKETGAAAGAKGKALYEPIRLALTGEIHGPPLKAVVYILGRAEVGRLLNAALGVLA